MRGIIVNISSFNGMLRHAVIEQSLFNYKLGTIAITGYVAFINEDGEELAIPHKEFNFQATNDHKVNIATGEKDDNGVGEYDFFIEMINQVAPQFFTIQEQQVIILDDNGRFNYAA